MILKIIRINSSKVYCKLIKIKFKDGAYNVLIVAKCIVNIKDKLKIIKEGSVLIVAKCIVNEEGKILTVEDIEVLIVAKCIVNIHSYKKLKVRILY